MPEGDLQPTFLHCFPFSICKLPDASWEKCLAVFSREFLQFFCLYRGSAIAKIIGHNVVKHSEQFETQVSMWVFEELIDGKKLTEIINETHENVKYLPNHKLPENVVSYFSAVPLKLMPF